MSLSFNQLQRFNHRLMTAPSGQCSRALARASFDHAQESLVRSAAVNRSSSVHRNPAPRITPTTGSTYASPATINLEATATNPGAAITKVQFYGKGQLLATLTSPPYTYQWTGVLKGSYPVTARATDSLGVATTSAKVNIAVVNGSAPAVSITAPASNAIYLSAPATISLIAAASTLTGTVTKVEYFNGSTLIGTVTTASSPGLYNLQWANVAPGTYTITAKATSSVNLTTISDPITVVVDAAPALTLTTPTNNAIYQAGDNIAIAVNASDSDGMIAKVDFYQGTTLLAAVTSGAGGVFTTTWSSVAAGTYSITATATDNLGATTTTAPVNVTVNAPPSATWTAPVDGTTATAPASVTLTVNATDSDGTINKVDFYNGATLIGTVNSGQSGNSGNNYSFNWTNIAGGTYTLSAIATDNNGATVNAGSVTIIVNTPPTIAITSPANNSTQNAPANIVITATASDSDGTISQVDFYSGSNLVGSITTGQAGNAGSSYTFNWANVASSTYTLTAVATDNQNASTTSQTVTVNVNTITAEAGIYYIHPDHLGTPRAITKAADNTKVWEWKNDDPFGANVPNEDPANTGTSFKYNLRFPGQVADPETATFQNWMRDYDPFGGRYIQSDPLGLVDSPSTYAYALSSPLAFVDPQGLSVFKIIVLCKDGYKIIRKIGFKEAVRRARKGEDVLASSKRSARQVADAASGGAKKSVKDAPHKPGQSPHYHPNPRTGSHVLYSMASSLTFSNYSPCEDCITAKLAAVGDFFNPLSLPKDVIDLVSDDEDE